MFESKYGLSVGQLLDEAYRNRSEKEVIVDGARRMTYRELYNEVIETASGLQQLGVRHGDRVAVCLPTWHEFFVITFAIAKLGAVLVPLNPRYRLDELEYILNDCTPKVIFCTGHMDDVDNFQQFRKLKESMGFVERLISIRYEHPDALSYEGLRSLRPVQEDRLLQQHLDVKEDVFAIIYTSGTTGKPKGAMLTHENVVNRVVTGMISGGNTSGDVALHSSPYFHILGLSGLIGVIAIEAKAVLLEKYNADRVLQLIEREKITTRSGVPTMFILEMSRPSFKDHDLSSLRKVAMAAASASKDVIDRVKREFGCWVQLSYGMTETTGLVANTRPDDDETAQVETVGKAAPGVEVKVVDEHRKELPLEHVGELAVRTPGLMKGYYNLPELTREVMDEDGWFYTGDLVTLSPEGYIRIVGRKKEMIVRGGFKVYPLEVEEVIARHPDVAEVVVIGLPDTVLGEVSCAVIHRKQGSELTAEQLREFIKEKLADYKKPDHIVFRDSLPKNAMGKVQKHVLRGIILAEKCVALR